VEFSRTEIKETIVAFKNRVLFVGYLDIGRDRYPQVGFASLNFRMSRNRE
jgi:hypothetical protein